MRFAERHVEAIVRERHQARQALRGDVALDRRELERQRAYARAQPRQHLVLEAFDVDLHESRRTVRGDEGIERSRTHVDRAVPALELAAHSLKSNSASFGAGVLSELCRELEHAAQRGDLTNAESRLQVIEAAFEDVQRELRAIASSR